MAEGGTAVRDEKRRRAMAGFLAAQGWPGHTPKMLAGDASFRRYFRVVSGDRSAVSRSLKR